MIPLIDPLWNRYMCEAAIWRRAARMVAEDDYGHVPIVMTALIAAALGWPDFPAAHLVQRVVSFQRAGDCDTPLTPDETVLACLMIAEWVAAEHDEYRRRFFDSLAVTSYTAASRTAYHAVHFDPLATPPQPEDGQ